MGREGVVLLVPGIGGNLLSSQPTFGGYAPPLTVWMDTVGLAAGAWRLMGLQADGVTPTVPLTGPLVPGLPLPSYYDQIADYLTRRGWRVVGAALDWRQLLWRDAQRLASQIEALAADGPVHLWCHSRGGLVARAAFPLLASSGYLAAVGRCVGLGVPHQGAWSAAGLLGGWNDTAYYLDLLMSATSSGPARLLALPGVLDIVRTWPAAYELLPSPLSPWERPESIALVYDPAWWSRIRKIVSPAWLSAARQQWQTLAPVPQSIPWLDVVGMGTMTPYDLTSPERGAYQGGYAWSSAGDGTVTAASASAGDRPTLTTPTSHGALAYDGRVAGWADLWLSEGWEGDREVVGSVLR